MPQYVEISSEELVNMDMPELIKLMKLLGMSAPATKPEALAKILNCAVKVG